MKELYITSLVRNSSQKFQRNGTFQALGSHAPIVPTKILGDPDELDRHLVHSVPETYNIRHVQADNAYDNGYIFSQESDVEMHVSRQNLMTFHRSYPFILSFRQHVPSANCTVFCMKTFILIYQRFECAGKSI